MKGGVRRFFSVVGGSRMLVGVELLVVQLYGDEPKDSCEDLNLQMQINSLMICKFTVCKYAVYMTVHAQWPLVAAR